MNPVVGQLSPGSWEIDTTRSKVGFSVRHMMVSKVKGTFDVFDGTITAKPGEVPSVRAEVSVDSLNTNNSLRDAGTKAADFFGAAAHPVGVFVSTDVTADGARRYWLDGDLTLRGVTKPIRMALKFNGVRGDRALFDATVSLNRKDFGVDMAASVVTGGAVVGDRVDMALHIEAVLQG